MQEQITDWTLTWREPMMKFALLNLSSLDDADDVVQDTFEALLQIKQEKLATVSIKSYLFGILKNKIKDKLRVRYRHPVSENSMVYHEFETLMFEETGKWAENSAPVKWSSLEDEHELELLVSIIDICIEKLPKKLSSVFSMKYLLECETDDILVSLNISKDIYWQSMSRARKQIHYCLNHAGYGGKTQ